MEPSILPRFKMLIKSINWYQARNPPIQFDEILFDKWIGKQPECNDEIIAAHEDFGFNTLVKHIENYFTSIDTANNYTDVELNFLKRIEGAELFFVIEVNVRTLKIQSGDKAGMICITSKTDTEVEVIRATLSVNIKLRPTREGQRHHIIVEGTRKEIAGI